MRRFGIFYLVALLTVVLGWLSAPPSAFSQYAPDGPVVRGTVKSSDGKPMEGVAVSIRGEGKTFVTSVFTNQQGTYVFPPVDKGKYKLWAQAVGFQAAKADVDVASGRTQQVAALELKPVKNFQKQLTGVEWMNSFPETNPQDRRAKQIFASNCTGCHSNQFALQNRFDANGWGKIVSIMSLSSEGTQPRPGATGSEMMNTYKEEIVGFLTSVRGPNIPSYTLKPLPRPTGESARVVITEFDLPRPEAPSEFLPHNGSDWSEGTPSRWEGRAAHDVAVGPDGNIYFSDDRVIDRTVGKLDPRTGKVTSYKFADKNGNGAGTHGATVDPKGNVWVDNQSNGNLTKFDPKAEQFQDFSRSASIPAAGGTITADSKGNVWSTQNNGALKLDPTTGEYTFYRLVTPDKGTYGITIDVEGNAWFTSPGSDRVDVVDARTGKVSEIVFEPISDNGMEVSVKDRESYLKVRANQNTASPLHKCPRRIGADPNGDVVWVALFCANRIAKIDIHTQTVTEYPLPHKYSGPYSVVVDKNHMVWIDMLNTDMVAKFDPKTAQFTEYQMPSRGTDIRHLAIDNSTEEPTIWAPYNRSNKIARIQFRKASEMQ